MHEKHEAGHMLLARLGKKRLRPGGKQGTDWLIRQVSIGANTRILEVACNMGTTAIELAKRYKCHITGIDLHDASLQKATHNARIQGVSDCVRFMRANATALPFDDASFDIVINEAMLTMLDNESKRKALQEYARVLRPGGYLLTHDLIIRSADTQNSLSQLHSAINVKATPLSEHEWKALLSAQGFKVRTLTGPMSLLSPMGMIRDEGFLNTLKIVKNAMKQENRPMFMRMFRLFRQSKGIFGFIAACSQKVQ
ncbi:class I SAM-dependent methyltransferase [Oxalobacter vibrioformis]|uniref:Class I SAM-dependent methyltransferase n=1 Tax=Oxalobacter vibrioformis TaxID=933080 RepID=A0A9E9LX15_9BURK|nr:class I SAM-dependent methyltransferase [Oxalobacter vibrioformis]WAW10429.1 class I SAM-dependent methyltransferase [Oxalobacter vibrioformis]